MTQIILTIGVFLFPPFVAACAWVAKRAFIDDWTTPITAEEIERKKNS